MTSTGFKSPWQGVWSLDEIVNRRIRRPRTTGVTMVIDTGLGASSLRDSSALAGDHIDHWKFGFGTSALMPLSVLEEKLDSARSTPHTDLSRRHLAGGGGRPGALPRLHDASRGVGFRRCRDIRRDDRPAWGSSPTDDRLRQERRARPHHRGRAQGSKLASRAPRSSRSRRCRTWPGAPPG